MAQDIDFVWNEQEDADYLMLDILLDGGLIGNLNLPGDSTSQRYAAIEQPYTRYAGQVRKVGPIIPCTVVPVEGSGSGSGGG